MVERAGRLTGVDAARGLALFGMMLVHILPGRAPDGSVARLAEIAAGRASALFAVLAGVGLALGSGGARPPSGAALAAARRAVLGRAVVIAALGLTLGSLGVPVAVILAYYGVLFCVAVPVLGWPARRLAGLAGGCVVATPVLSQVLRTVVRREDLPNVGWADLADPGYLVGVIVLFGYYPVLTWAAYLFAGMAVGRCSLARPRTAARVAVTGAVSAAAGLGVDGVARVLAGGTPALAARLGTTPDDLARSLSMTMYGTTPTDSWWWLLLAGRHSGSGPDVLNTGGSALLVLGGCLLVMPRLGRLTAVMTPLVAVGAMPLTLYTMHALALSWAGGAGGESVIPSGVLLAIHGVMALALAAAAGAPARRGPLERIAAWGADQLRPARARTR